MSFENGSFLISNYSALIVTATHVDEGEYQCIEPLQQTCCHNMIVRIVNKIGGFDVTKSKK